jgi:thermitase
MGYDIASGTSMASPIVAATAALLWSTQTCPTNADVRAKVLSTTERKPGTETFWANGRVNAFKAVDGSCS